MAHEINNPLAAITTCAEATMRDMRQSSDSIDEYVQALDRRIQSMADAHALLSQNRWDGVDLAELVRCQLAPNATDANAVIEGPNAPS